MVIYRSPTGEDLSAVITATAQSLGVAHLPALAPEHVDLTVFTPGSRGTRSEHGLWEHAGCHEESDVAFDAEPAPGTWRWPEAVRIQESTDS